MLPLRELDDLTVRDRETTQASDTVPLMALAAVRGVRRDWWVALAVLVLGVVAVVVVVASDDDGRGEARSGARSTTTLDRTGATLPEDELDGLDPFGFEAPTGHNVVTLCSDLGPARITFPVPVEFEGPRPLRGLDAPSEATFAVGFSDDRSIRYNAYLVHRADAYGPDDERLVHKVPRGLNPDVGSVLVGPVDAVDDHAEANIRERFDDRTYGGRAFGSKGAVLVVDVAIYEEETSAAVVEAAQEGLDAMLESIDFPGLDDPGQACVEPSQTGS
jgi:hypothetical protein